MAEVRFDKGVVDIDDDPNDPKKIIVSMADGEGAWSAVSVDRAEAIDLADAILAFVQGRDQAEVRGEREPAGWFEASLAQRKSVVVPGAGVAGRDGE